MTFEEILNRFEKVQRNGAGWKALCPAHADKNPSLSITEGDEKTLLKCFAGCTTEAVLQAKGLTMGDLFTSQNGKTGTRTSSSLGPVVEEYLYTDEASTPLFKVVRHRDPKTFRQHKSDGQGGWISGEGCMKGVRLVLYCLPALKNAEHVLVVEGEKDVATAWSLGFTATTNAGGAGKWRDEYSECLRGKNITIIPDSDEPGRKHAEQVAKSLAGKAASIAILNLPEPLKDLSEWPLSRESLLELIKAAPPWTPEASEATLFHTPEECENVPDISFAIGGFLQNDGMTFIGGLSGHGKTWLALSVVKALLTGEKLWGLFPVSERATRVIYLIPEVGLSSFMSRVRRMGLLPFIKDRRLLIRTLSKGPAPDLDDPRMLSAVKDAHVVLDTAARFADGEENSASDNARGLAADIFGLLAAGARSVLCAHHSPKAFLKETTMSLEGILRGTGDIGAMATTVWGVKQLDEPENIVYLECVKARDFTHCQPFQLRGRPCIDDGGDFVLHRAPGESGLLADEQRALNPGNDSRKNEKDDRRAMVRAWDLETPGTPSTEIVEKFRALGMDVAASSVRRYRAEIAKELSR